MGRVGETILIQASLPLLLKERGSYGSAPFAVLRNRQLSWGVAQAISSRAKSRKRLVHACSTWSVTAVTCDLYFVGPQWSLRN